jgi:hypothetical protein
MNRLSTTDLNRVLKRNDVTKHVYLGGFPACVIPKTRKKRYFFITNTDQHDKSGKHWTAWMMNDDKVEFFDSFGRSPENEQFPEQFRYHIIGKKVLYSDFRVQEYSSNACGYFCMYYIYFRSLGLDFNYIIKQLKNLKDNDDIVISFINSLI